MQTSFPFVLLFAMAILMPIKINAEPMAYQPEQDVHQGKFDGCSSEKSPRQSFYLRVAITLCCTAALGELQCFSFKGENNEEYEFCRCLFLGAVDNDHDDVPDEWVPDNPEAKRYYQECLADKCRTFKKS
ncbi:MAG: hypothetical protein EBZ48_14780 [Proteobacteria bacterium]|nr:hypothetical protein [Pseudomonadota bacterium]